MLPSKGVFHNENDCDSFVNNLGAASLSHMMKIAMNHKKSVVTTPRCARYARAYGVTRAADGVYGQDRLTAVEYTPSAVDTL